MEGLSSTLETPLLFRRPCNSCGFSCRSPVPQSPPPPYSCQAVDVLFRKMGQGKVDEGTISKVSQLVESLQVMLPLLVMPQSLHKSLVWLWGSGRCTARFPIDVLGSDWTWFRIGRKGSRTHVGV